MPPTMVALSLQKVEEFFQGFPLQPEIWPGVPGQIEEYLQEGHRGVEAAVPPWAAILYGRREDITSYILIYVCLL